MWKRPVGVWLVSEIADCGLRIADWSIRIANRQSEIRNPKWCTSVLRTARSATDGILCFERGDKLLFERVPVGAIDFDVEGVTEEIVDAGVFVESADQIADGVREVFLAACGCIEQHVAG